MFEYVETWADYRLIVYQEYKLTSWAFQIEAWSVDRFLVKTGRHGYDDPRDAIVIGRNQLFTLFRMSLK